MEPWISHYDSTAGYSQLSEEEVLLLLEREALAKASEALSLRRRAVAAACRKVEEEVLRQVQEEDAHRCGAEVARELAVVEVCRMDERQAMQTKAAEDTHQPLELEKRLRAEIEARATAQRKSIDAARARVSVLRNTDRAHVAAAI